MRGRPACCSAPWPAWRLACPLHPSLLLNPRWGIGAEYRQKPDNLRFAREDSWSDAFVAWFPNKRVAVVAAYANLGSIATLDRQRGAYVSVQLSQ